MNRGVTGGRETIPPFRHQLIDHGLWFASARVGVGILSRARVDVTEEGGSCVPNPSHDLGGSPGAR